MLLGKGVLWLVLTSTPGDLLSYLGLLVGTLTALIFWFPGVFLDLTPHREGGLNVKKRALILCTSSLLLSIPKNRKGVG